MLPSTNRPFAELDCDIVTSASSSDEMSSMMGSGLSITLKGPDEETLQSMSEDVMDIVGEVDGYENIDNGMEEAADELQLAPGVLAVAAVKATNVVVELPSPSRGGSPE